MKCPRPGCSGSMHRFRPAKLVHAWYKTGTGVVMRLRRSHWKQVGLMCDGCGFLEFYCQNPKECLRDHREYFETTEPDAT